MWLRGTCASAVSILYLRCVLKIENGVAVLKKSVSILYLRCCLGVLWLFVYWCLSVSILYLRCQIRPASRAGADGGARFNSLFEMPGLMEFRKCRFLSFLSVFWRGGV